MAEIIVDEILVNASDKQKSWRLIYSGNKGIALFESEGETWTTNDMYCADDLKEVKDFAKVNDIDIKGLNDENQIYHA